MPRTPKPVPLRLRREAWGFAVGSVFFAVGAIPAYADAVGPVWDAATFAAGSVFFTLAGFIQLALSGRRPPRRDATTGQLADWWSAAIQFIGTILFNVSTFAVLIGARRETGELSTGWVPDAWGSVCFLLASALALVAASRRRELWDHHARSWRGTWLNMAGSVAFGAAAVGAYVLPMTGELVNVRWVNVGTFVGALCFFTAAVLSRRAVVRAIQTPAATE
jgi:hypothetical protein